MGWASYVALGALTIAPALVILWLVRRLSAPRAGTRFAAGVVEAAAPPVVVAYEEARYELGASTARRMDGKTVYLWEEDERRIEAHPFVLRTAEMAIRVEPATQVVLLWAPDHLEKIRERRRIRRAILEPGATVEVYGAFTADPPTLRPPPRAPLLISKRPLTPMLAAVRGYLRRRAIGVGIAVTGIVHVLIDPWLGVPMPGASARVWIVVGFLVLVSHYWRANRPWLGEKLSERAVR